MSFLFINKTLLLNDLKLEQLWMSKFQYLIFVLKRPYICYCIICMAVPLIFAKVTPKQCPGAILISKWFQMQSASWVSVKCESRNFEFRVATGSLQVLSHNSKSLWVVSCELMITLRLGNRISLHISSLDYQSTLFCVCM